MCQFLMAVNNSKRNFVVLRLFVHYVWELSVQIRSHNSFSRCFVLGTHVLRSSFSFFGGKYPTESRRTTGNLVAHRNPISSSWCSVWLFSSKVFLETTTDRLYRLFESTVFKNRKIDGARVWTVWEYSFQKTQNWACQWVCSGYFFSEIF